MSITEEMENWPAFESFLSACPGWQAMKQSPTQDITETANGVLYEPQVAPMILEFGDTCGDGLNYVFGCLKSGEPVVRCQQTGRVWVMRFESLVLQAIREGVGR